MLKTMLFDAGGQTVAVLLPGDHEVNEEKVARLFFPTLVRAFDEKDFAERGFAKGYVGPQGMPDEALVIADPSVRLGANWVTGANRADHHVAGANEGRDFRVDRWEDVVQAVEGDPCPVDGGGLLAGRGIVVGHIYQLGTRYSEPLKATFLDEDGTEQPYLMGCYGIGISRIMAAVAEQYHDDDGLTLPPQVAPYEAVVIATNMDQPAVVETAEGLYESLEQAGVEAVFDDREVTAGVKFADADLIGYPVQVVVGKRGVEAGAVDVKTRASGERAQVPLDGVVLAVRELLGSDA
jgi:prolyl-tRNA synthetase